MSFLKRLFGEKNNLLSKMLQQGATIIDVRTPEEYGLGHAPGAINIPLDQIKHKLQKIKKMKSPLVLCCASGIRSANATNYLRTNKMENVHNGGRWSKVAKLQRA